MNILFKNIPIGTQGFELAEFIKTNFTEGGTGNENISITAGSIEMLEREDGFTHPIEQFGLVRIYSSDVAEKVIKQLNGTLFNGNNITVREYSNRLDGNDPRLKKKLLPKDYIEHRLKDRRVHNLIYSRLI